MAERGSSQHLSVSTQPREVHGVVHVSSSLYSRNFVSNFANSFRKTSIPPNKFKGFTGLFLISANKTKGVHGLTGFIPQNTPAPPTSRLTEKFLSSPSFRSLSFPRVTPVRPGTVAGTASTSRIPNVYAAWYGGTAKLGAKGFASCYLTSDLCPNTSASGHVRKAVVNTRSVRYQLLTAIYTY